MPSSDACVIRLLHKVWMKSLEKRVRLFSPQHHRVSRLFIQNLNPLLANDRSDRPAGHWLLIIAAN